MITLHNSCIPMTKFPAVVFFALLVVVSSVGPVNGQVISSSEYGPENGYLIIDGGNPSAEVQAKFIELGGGLENGRFVIIPTGAGIDRVYDEERVIQPWINQGVKNVTVLHTSDRDEANSEDFIEPLREATAVWLWGGRQWRYVDIYSGTKTFEALNDVLSRGGVIAGGSAGATIQGEYLVRGDTRGAHIVMTDEPEHQNGFSFLRRSAIDQHINARNRWDDLIPVVQRFPHLIGIGLSEGTAIVVQGDEFEVMGVWKVAVHDNTRSYQPWEKPYFVLSSGDVFNMKTRSIVSRGNGTGCPATPTPTGWIEVSSELLDQYSGDYEPLTVAREGSKIFAEMTGGRGELVPISTTQFIVEAIGATVTFERNEDGHVASVTMRTNCRNRRFQRLR